MVSLMVKRLITGHSLFHPQDLRKDTDMNVLDVTISSKKNATMNLLLPVMTIDSDTVPETKHLGREIEPACMCLYVYTATILNFRMCTWLHLGKCQVSFPFAGVSFPCKSNMSYK